jgi:hypothetical protein
MSLAMIGGDVHDSSKPVAFEVLRVRTKKDEFYQINQVEILERE